MSELLYQMATAHSYYYSAHEILLRIDNPAAHEVTAEFRHTPIWFFESRRGYLAYLKHIFDAYGQPCLQGEWLTCVGLGWMRPLCMAFAMKHFQLRDWLVFSQRYGSGFIEAITDAQKGDAAWEEARETLHAISNDGAVIHSQGVTLKFLDNAAKNSLPFEALVERVDRLYAKCYRGVDLATSSRGAEPGSGRQAVGASVQKAELGIFLARDAAWATGCLNERVDRPIIRYLFNQEPRAWLAIVPPLDDSADADLKSVQTLVPMGLRISLAEAYRRFRWKAPAIGEACLTATVPGKAEAFATEHIADAPLVAPLKATALPIGAGANPHAVVQTASGDLPDPQVDAASFYCNQP
jgi:phage gp29-like protein